jgi:hypothetical protein
MAYTNNPQISTYKTVSVPVSGKVLYRSGDVTDQRDLQIVNMYYDTVFQDSQNKEAIKRLVKRPGLATTTYNLTKDAAGDDLRGYFYDVDQNAFYWAVNDNVYAVKPDVGTSVRTVCTLNTSTGSVGFCSYLKSDNTRRVIFSDGTDLWVDTYATPSCSRVVDADMPTPHEPCPIYIDGYVFLIKKNTGDIYNSNLDDPTAWTAGDFITAEISSDYLLRLVKAKNYIVAFGYNSLEYFYDAGNATGSPLSRNASPYRSIGYITGLCTIGDVTFFVGQDEKLNVCVFMLDGFEIKRISNSVVERTIQTNTSSVNAKSRANLDKPGYAVSVSGHNYYVLPLTTTTWVYDLSEKEWYEWKGSDGNGLAIQAAWSMYNGSMYVAIDGQTYISVLSPALYQDFGSNYTCRYTSELIDGGTANWKYLHKFALNCSQEESSGTSNVTLTWSDNDWNSSSGASRSINVFSISPQIYRLGRFRKRSFRMEYAANYPFWLLGFNLHLNVGQV